MLDLRAIRRDPGPVRSALARRGPEAAASLDRALELEARRVELVPRVEELRQERNAASKGRRVAPSESERESLASLAARERALGAELSGVEAALVEAMALVANPPSPEAPAADTILRTCGPAGREGRDHLELAGPGIDMEHAAVLSGARFAYLRGDIAMLWLALVRYAMDKLRSHGFEPVLPPVLVREHALYGTGFLPDTEQQIYAVGDDGLYLSGTSEVALAALHAGELLSADALPARYAGFSSCFRREAGAAGRDTRGIFRVHQFDKVEMFAFVQPSESAAEHERILAVEEEILVELALPYRVVDIAVGDLGASAIRKFDCEGWLPGQGRYRELTSCSNTTDFQARRLDIRFRPEAGDGESGGRPVHVHTLNGTAVTGRTIIALLENGQRADGSIELPPALVAAGAPQRLRAADGQ